VLAACGEREADETAPAYLAPVGLDEHVVFVDQARAKAHLLRAATPAPDPVATRVRLPDNPVLAERRQGSQNEILILCQGDPDPDRGSPVPPALVVFGQNGIDRSYELQAGFDALVQSEDGRYAVALFSPTGSGGAVDTLLFNPNEIAIVDLDAVPESGQNPAIRTLRSFSSVPERVVVSPVLDLAGAQRRLAVVLFGNVVSLIDLNHPERDEYTVPLTDDVDRVVGLEQVRFDLQEAKVYLRGTSSTDVYVVQLTPSTETTNDFKPSLNQLGAGIPLYDMELYGENADRRLLVAAGEQALVIHADTNLVTSVGLDQSVSHVLLFEGTAPFDPAVEQRALLYGSGGDSVTLLDLDQIEERGSRNAEMLDLGRPFQSVMPLDDNLVLIVHDRGLSLLDLEERTVAPIAAQVTLTEAIPDPVLDRVWVAPAQQSKVGWLDLVKFHPDEVRLDHPIVSALPLTRSEHKRFVAVHQSAVGHVTILNADDPKRLDQAVSLHGFLLNDTLD
jgi:hypothetical protein